MANLPTDTQIPEHSLVRFITILLLTAISLSGYSQKTLSSTSKKALKLYEKGQNKAKDRDFESAITLFSSALKQDPSFYEAHMRIGSLYNAMGMEDSVYSNFISYIRLTPTPNPTILNRMASMAFARGEYSRSQKYLSSLFDIVPDARSAREMTLLEKSLSFAKNQVAVGMKLEITPLPVQVNKFPLQYLPTLTIDNSTLVYTKRDFIDGDEDIVVSYFQDGNWTEAQSISPRINSPLNEGACTISADGKVMIFTSCDKRDSFGSCDLYISRKTGAQWSKPRNLGKSVNSQYWESQPSLSADGKTIYFSSNRPGGQGGRDLWVSEYSNQSWSRPVNLGKTINSFKDETTPFIHPNGETLYFSSNSFVGMGGFDLMRSGKSDSVWSEPENLGYPINSHNDEVALLIAGDGKTAYFAKEAQKDGRIIDSKIVSFRLPKTHQAKPATYIIGRVLDNKTEKPLKAKIEIVDLDKNSILFKGESDSISGNYTMVLPSDVDIAFYVKKKGYLFYEGNFFTESNSNIAPDTIEIRLKPISINEFLVLRNIYFELNSYELGDKSLSELTNVVEILRENPGMTVEISGHTDNLGSKSYNKTLSEKRAEKVLQEIVNRQIDRSRLSFRGFGDERPVDSNDTEEGRKSNRRIEFRVIRVMP
ncbi:MAG: OmpA family protein [Cyclobacteriaceae bacterium]